MLYKDTPHSFSAQKTLFNLFILKKIAITETVYYLNLLNDTHNIALGSLYSLRNISPKIRKRGYFPSK